ncbi:BON domain-containing protein [Stenotrophomonas sp. ATCM1_4]|uniref:BON domain-containing protein n=1 Tax=Stenotrophomonas capsici TaxID=3110230 RepID=A0ABU5V086_9GAMM|nr:MULTISPECIES: BON domain-containing protein [unclassified Stenotrophomonas]MEA5666741.1 BON domain-containing protein [Stenotrophomonas sp. MH1]TDB27000.1 BON domain-containing protein [Stenotrophomonas sp. ATCM1_4]
MKRALLSRWALLAALPLCASAAIVSAENPPTEREEAKADSEQPGSDAWITTKVKADLLTTSNVPGLEIKVETINGTVNLSGTVSSQPEKERAVAVARGIQGVKQVDATGIRVMGAPAR